MNAILFKCTICGKIYKRQSAYITHTRVHTPCPICGIILKKPAEVQGHINLHMMNQEEVDVSPFTLTPIPENIDVEYEVKPAVEDEIQSNIDKLLDEAIRSILKNTEMEVEIPNNQMAYYDFLWEIEDFLDDEEGDTIILNVNDGFYIDEEGDRYIRELDF